MKIYFTFMGCMIFTSLLMDSDCIIDHHIETDVHACREETTDDKEYTADGIPKNRGWLTSSEWKGEHLSSYRERKKFQEWKKQHISDFVAWLKVSAKEESKVSGIPYQLYVGQSILETQYGTSRLCHQASNYFGHKFKGNKEDRHMFLIAADDSPTDRFTRHKSAWWSFRHHSKILNGRYRNRIKGEPTIDKWVDCLCGGRTIQQSKSYVNGGGMVYATSCYKGDVGYAQKLIRIIKKYKL